MSNYPSAADGWRKGQRVYHSTHGWGTIQRVFRADECADVVFDWGYHVRMVLSRLTREAS